MMRFLFRKERKALKHIYQIQTINGAIADFKDGIDGEISAVATQYLHYYRACFKETRAELNNVQIPVASYH